MGVKLPDTYRTAMMNQNGGSIICSGETWTLHPIWDKSEKKRLKRTANDVVRETAVMASWTGWPNNAVCIAGNGTGDALIFFSDSNSCVPVVYRWSHETGQTEKMASDFSKLQRA
jgi:hypothetical protein